LRIFVLYFYYHAGHWIVISDREYHSESKNR
jgi:hypothetical protein